MAGDAAAAVVEEEDSKCKIAQDPQGSDDAEEQAGQPEDLKVVVSLKEAQGHHRCTTALVGPAHRVVR